MCTFPILTIIVQYSDKLVLLSFTCREVNAVVKPLYHYSKRLNKFFYAVYRQMLVNLELYILYSRTRISYLGNLTGEVTSVIFLASILNKSISHYVSGFGESLRFNRVSVFHCFNISQSN